MCSPYFTVNNYVIKMALQRRKIEESGEKKGNHENSKKRKKPQNHQTQDQPQNAQQDLDLLRRKEKNETTDAEGGTGSVSRFTNYIILHF